MTNSPPSPEKPNEPLSAARTRLWANRAAWGRAMSRANRHKQAALSAHSAYRGPLLRPSDRNTTRKASAAHNGRAQGKDTRMSVTVEREVVLPLSLEEAYDAWLEIVFIEGGGLGKPAIEQAGDPETRVGLKRRVPGWIREEIMDTLRPAKIVYKVVSGPFPVHSHLGTVVFEQGSDDNATTVRWQAVVEPIFGFRWIIKSLISWSFGHMLTHLRDTVAERIKVAQ
eukprot:m.28306 g.28306  ORF g.28306 m.28306 type:complete len:226 (-) comp4917_c0_seq2:89-766(-)